MAKLGTSKTLVGRPVASRVARFSCRGPNSVSPAILKVCLLLFLFGSLFKYIDASVDIWDCAG